MTTFSERMSDLPERLRGMVGQEVGDVPVLIHQAADEIERLRAALQDVHTRLIQMGLSEGHGTPGFIEAVLQDRWPVEITRADNKTEPNS